jgi:hypothetical protein
VTYEFARWSINFLASEVVELFARQIINLVGLNVSDVLPFAGEYSSIHRHRLFGRSSVFPASSAARAAPSALVDKTWGRSEGLERPISTSRRMASGRVATSCASRHASIADSSGSCQRMPICVPLPVVGGRPRFFFGVPLIDLLMKRGTTKASRGEGTNFRPGSGSNLRQGSQPCLR